MLMSMIAPDPMPAPPMPCTTLPTMRALLEGAEAQTMDPISKIETRTINTHFAG
jgi:hypothetical protein